MKRDANKILVIDDDKTVGKAGGAAAFLKKPVDPEALKKAIADLLPAL